MPDSSREDVEHALKHHPRSRTDEQIAAVDYAAKRWLAFLNETAVETLHKRPKLKKRRISQHGR